MIPLFSSHFSLGRSILTLEKANKSKDNGPDSIIDLAIKHNFKDVFLLETSIASFPDAYEAFKESGLNLRFGLKLICCNNIEDKSEESLKTNHKICIFFRNTQGYYDAIKIWSKAATVGKYYEPRIDIENLKMLWNNDNLLLAIPFYDSFLFKNNIEGARCLPNFEFTKPIFFVENNDLPFDFVMRDIVSYYCKDKHEIQEAKSIFYANRVDFKAFQTFRCISKRSVLSNPKLSNHCSAEFCLESLLECKS